MAFAVFFNAPALAFNAIIAAVFIAQRGITCSVHFSDLFIDRISLYLVLSKVADKIELYFHLKIVRIRGEHHFLK